MPSTGAVDVATGATLAVNLGGTNEWTTATGGNGTIGGLLAGLGGQSGGTVTYTGAVTLGFDTANASTTQADTGVIGNVGTTLGLSKLGTGTLELSNANTYTGGTAVSAGLLKINGIYTSATGAVAVSGGALGGIGIVGGAVTVSGTGGINLADGAVETLELKSTLAITGAAGANNLAFDLGAAAAGSDKIAVTGDVTMTTAGAGVITINQLGGSATRANANTYDLITGSAVPANSNFKLVSTKAFGQTFSLSDSTSTALKLKTTQVSGVVLTNTTLTGTNASWIRRAIFPAQRCRTISPTSSSIPTLALLR